MNGLRLEVGNEILPLRVLDRSAKFVAGQGGLPTLRIEARLLADLPNDWEEHDAGYYADRTTMTGSAGVRSWSGAVPASHRELHCALGPTRLTSCVPIRRIHSPARWMSATARFTLAPGNGIGTVRATEGIEMDNSAGVPGRVASLISADRLSASIIMISMLIAFFWGAAHALTPGHGKTVVAAYLVGTGGTARHAGLLGLTVTLTHTVGVFALGAVTLYLSRYIVPEALTPG